MVLLQSTKMMDEFMRLAKANTTRNLETCGVLAGSLVRISRAFASHLGALFFSDRCSVCPIVVLNAVFFDKSLLDFLNKIVFLFCFAEEGHLLCLYSDHSKAGIHI